MGLHAGRRRSKRAARLQRADLRARDGNNGRYYPQADARLANNPDLAPGINCCAVCARQFITKVCPVSRRVRYCSAHHMLMDAKARAPSMRVLRRIDMLKDDGEPVSIERDELGLARHAAGDFARAAELQTAYLRACEISGDERGEGAARQARAYARRDAGDAAGAERDLLQFLAPEGAERRGRELRRERERKTEARLENVRRRNEKGNDGSGDRLLGGTPEDTFDADELELLVAEARGWRALGKMQSARGGAADAALSHEKFFELATVCGDKALEREARVCLGEARAAARQDALMRAVTERAEAPAERLMAWKSDGASFFDV